MSERRGVSEARCQRGGVSVRRGVSEAGVSDARCQSGGVSVRGGVSEAECQ